MIETIILAIHIFGRIGVTVAMTYGLVYFGSALNKAERLGMGLMGGGSLMTVPIIIAGRLCQNTPFDVWSPTLVTWGVVIFFVARMFRIVRHARANDLARTEAAAYLANRGKLG